MLTNTPADARRAALASLNRALCRFEHMASAPRHLQFPLVGDINATLRAERKARERGDHDRADELADWCEREIARSKAYLAWQNGKSRRSRVAWQALADRLQTAIEWAVRVGAIDGESVVCASDLQRECLAHVRNHDVIANLDSLN